MNRKANRLIGGAPLSAQPKLKSSGQVPRREPEAEYRRPYKPEPRVSLKRREELDAAAAWQAMTDARPLKPPRLLESDNHTRSAGALELAREIRRGSYTP
jgi:hypothetical protein